MGRRGEQAAWPRGGELGKAGVRKVLGNAGVNETEGVKPPRRCQRRPGAAFSQDRKAGDGQGMGCALPSNEHPLPAP